MELEKFSSQLIERMERKDKHFSSKIYKYSVDVQNKATNSNIGPIIYFTEETSELQQLLCKYARGKISGNCYQVYEELADVELCLEKFKKQMCISDEDLKIIKEAKEKRLR